MDKLREILSNFPRAVNDTKVRPKIKTHLGSLKNNVRGDVQVVQLQVMPALRALEKNKNPRKRIYR